MTLTSSTIDWEEIEQEVLFLLVDNLNDKIQAIDLAKTTLDQALAAKLGRMYEAKVTELVPLENFSPGHRPSFLEAPSSTYPNVSVMCFESETGGDVNMDTFHGVILTVSIEMMAKAGPYDINDIRGVGEELVNKRIKRMTEAAHAVLLENRTLNGLVFEIPEPPHAIITNVFTDIQPEYQDSRFFWQMSRLDYGVLKLAQAY